MSDRPRAEPKRRAVVEALVKASKPDETVAWFCTNCGTVYSDKGGHGKYDAERCAVRRPQRYARHCPATVDQTPCTEWACEDCGAECSAYQWYCSKCIGKHRTDSEDEKLAKTKDVIAAKDYPSDQGVVWDGNYHQCLEDLVDHCDNRDIELPRRVWATKPSFFQLNPDGILEDAWENWSEGCEDMGMDQICAEDEFKAAVEAFNKGQSARIFWECGTAVDLTGWSDDDEV